MTSWLVGDHQVAVVDVDEGVLEGSRRQGATGSASRWQTGPSLCCGYTHMEQERERERERGTTGKTMGQLTISRHKGPNYKANRGHVIKQRLYQGNGIYH